MSNRFQGVVTVHDPDGHAYTICMDMNAMVALEEHFSTADREVTFNEIWRKAQALNMRYVRAFVWKCFAKYHPSLTQDEVNDIVQRCGGVLLFFDTIAKVVSGIQPDPKDLEALGVAGGDRNPPAAQDAKAGTGTPSKRPAGVSA